MVRLRPAVPDDEPEILRVLRARDERDFHDSNVTSHWVVAHWRSPHLDAARDAAVAITELEAIAGFGVMFASGALGAVHPEHEARGAGARLLNWTEQRARELGQDCHRQRIAESNMRARALLQAAAYTHTRSVWQMVHDLRDLPVVPPLPTGIAVYPLDPERDARALHAADAAAFANNADYVAQDLETFNDQHLATADLDLTASAVARRGNDIAGYTVCRGLPSSCAAGRASAGGGFIDLLAVAAPERGRGLGAALLSLALRKFADAGRPDARLEVASDNPAAVRLYERAGMVRRNAASVWEKPVAS